MPSFKLALTAALTIAFAFSCSDDDGSDVLPKDPTGGVGGSAGSGGDDAGSSNGGGGSGGTGNGGTSAGTGGTSGGTGGSAGCTPMSVEPPDAGDAGVIDGGVLDAGDAGDGGALPALVSFERDIRPIFAQRCGPCHVTDSNGGHNVGSADLAVAYADSVEQAQDDLIERINGGGMPPSYADPPNNCDGPPGSPGCVTVEELSLIQTWIAQCFPQ